MPSPSSEPSPHAFEAFAGKGEGLEKEALIRRGAESGETSDVLSEAEALRRKLAGEGAPVAQVRHEVTHEVRTVTENPELTRLLKRQNRMILILASLLALGGSAWLAQYMGLLQRFHGVSAEPTAIPTRPAEGDLERHEVHAVSLEELRQRLAQAQTLLGELKTADQGKHEGIVRSLLEKGKLEDLIRAFQANIDELTRQKEALEKESGGLRVSLAREEGKASRVPELQTHIDELKRQIEDLKKDKALLERAQQELSRLLDLERQRNAALHGENRNLQAEKAGLEARLQQTVDELGRRSADLERTKEALERARAEAGRKYSEEEMERRIRDAVDDNERMRLIAELYLDLPKETVGEFVEHVKKGGHCSVKLGPTCTVYDIFQKAFREGKFKNPIYTMDGGIVPDLSDAQLQGFRIRIQRLCQERGIEIDEYILDLFEALIHNAQSRGDYRTVCPVDLNRYRGQRVKLEGLPEDLDERLARGEMVFPAKKSYSSDEWIMIKPVKEPLWKDFGKRKWRGR